MHDTAEFVLSILLAMFGLVGAAIILRRNRGGNCPGWRMRAAGAAMMGVGLLIQGIGVASDLKSTQFIGLVMLVMAAVPFYYGVWRRVR